METVNYKGFEYPKLQTVGFAAKFSMEFAKEFCKGIVYDVGFSRDEWKFPNAIGVDNGDEFNAMNLPLGPIDSIHSSHFLEHYIGRFQDVIEYWLTRLDKGGIIFLYLPNCEYQKYWAWGNKKHVHYLSPKIMNEFCQTLNISSYIVTDGYDLNGSFYCVIEK